MKRILLAVCLSFVTGLAFAGEGARGVDPQLGCPKAATKAQIATPAADAAGTAAPVAATPNAKAAARGGSSTSTSRLASPRWHSLLPGMFR
jgi:hypothetical protein